MMERYSDKAIDIINNLHTERLDYESEYTPLIDCANQCAAYENTGLTPEQCQNAKIIIESVFSDDTSKAERIRELLKADKKGRVVVLPCIKYCKQYGWQNITWDSKYGICAGSYDTREEAEEALRRTENG